MCEFCTKHGEGKKWYLRAENYSQELMRRLNVEKASERFVSHLDWSMNLGIRTMGLIKKMPEFVQKFTFGILEVLQKRTHFGQALPIEDVEEILGKMSTVVRLPCICRKFLGGDGGRYCLGISMSPDKSANINTMERLYSEKLDLHGFEYLTFDEVKALVRQYDKEALIHTVWTLQTPFIVGICNCDVKTCGALRFGMEGFRVMFKAEYVAVVDPEKCVGCRACIERCHLGAVCYNESTKKMIIDAKKCYGCGLCRVPCAKGAITLIDRREHSEAKDLWY